jgi:HEAT repeat protein
MNDVAVSLVALLDDPVEAVRRHAVVAVGRLGISNAVPGLIRRLGDPEQTVSRAARDALGVFAQRWSTGEGGREQLESMLRELGSVLLDRTDLVDRHLEPEIDPTPPGDIPPLLADPARLSADMRVRFASAWLIAHWWSGAEAVAFMKSLAVDEQPAMRKHALRLLRALDGKQSIDVLVAATRDDESPLQPLALELLSSIPSARNSEAAKAAVLDALRSPNEGIRLRALDAAATLGCLTLNPVRELLRDPAPSIRIKAASWALSNRLPLDVLLLDVEDLLSQDGGIKGEVQRTLIPLLAMDDPRVVPLLVSTLGTYGNPLKPRRKGLDSLGLGEESVPGLIAAFTNDARYRHTIIDVLAKLRSDRTLIALLRACADDDDYVRRTALSALDKFDPPWWQNPAARDALPTVLARAQDDSHTRPDRADDCPGTCALVLAALGESASLRPLLRRVNSYPSEKTVRALDTLAGDNLTALCILLEDPDDQVRMQTLQCMTRIARGGKLQFVTKPLLEGLLIADEDRHVRRSAAELAAVAPEMFSQASLIVAAGEHEREVRLKAVEALGQRRDRSILPDLVKIAVSDREGSIRARAIASLAEIEPEWTSVIESVEVSECLCRALSNPREEVRAVAAWFVGLRNWRGAPVSSLPQELE